MYVAKSLDSDEIYLFNDKPIWMKHPTYTDEWLWAVPYEDGIIELGYLIKTDIPHLSFKNSPMKVTFLKRSHVNQEYIQHIRRNKRRKRERYGYKYQV